MTHELVIEQRAVADLSAHPQNYRRHPDEQLVQLRASLRRFGFGKVSISVTPGGTLLTGHGLLQAAALEGFETVPVVVKDLSEAEAKAWLVADNETSRAALVDDDPAMLAQLLAEVQADTAEGLDGLGWTDDDLAGLLDELDADLAPDIFPERTALTRADLSAPAKLLERLGYLDGKRSVLDYGCGRGGDVERLAARGVDVVGWDPHFAPDVRLRKADLVLCLYVLNVIADREERAEALRQAWKHARHALFVAVMQGAPPVGQAEHLDGVVTSRGTFQRYYAAGEIEAYVAEVLGVEPVRLDSGFVCVPRSQKHRVDLLGRLDDQREAARSERGETSHSAIDDEAARADARELGIEDGQVWRCGEHIVACGDTFVVTPAVVAEFVEGGEVAAVVMDPPYAIYGSSTGIGSDIADDRMVRPFFAQVFNTARALVREFGHVYAFTDWRSWSSVWEAVRGAGLTMKNCLVWDKGGGGMGSNYANAHEFCAFAHRLPPPRAMQSQQRTGIRPVHRPNIVRHGRVRGAERRHNAAKPVALLVDLVEASTDPGDFVVDLFCGSGSTLIACERAGRRCITTDVEPRWVAVTLRRWAEATGGTFERVR